MRVVYWLCAGLGTFFLGLAVCTAAGEIDERVNSARSPAAESSAAGQEQDLEDLIQGFEDDTGTEPSDDSLDEILEGFDDQAALPAEPPAATEESAWLNLDGHLLLGVAVNIAHDAPQGGQTDWRGLSRLSPELLIEADAKFSRRWRAMVGANFYYDVAYGLNGRRGYTDEVIDAQESEAEIRDLYLAGRLSDHLDVKVGRQIVVWGKSDNIRVTDVINPLDLRRPGLTDIEDLRLPVTMTRLDYYQDAWNLTGLALHEHRFNKNPPFGSDYYPGDAPLPEDEVPDERFENTEWGLALNGVFSGKDLSLYWAEIYNDQPHLERDSDQPPPAVELVHERLTMIGAAYNHALGNWLLKTEAAWFGGLTYTATGDDSFSRLDVLIGAEYTGFSETTITLELVNRHIHNFDPRLGAAPDYAQEDEFQSVLRITKDFVNDTVTVTLVASTLGPLGQEGAFQRLSVEYDLLDALALTAGVVTYQSGDRYTTKKIGDNDRVFAEIKYSF